MKESEWYSVNVCVACSEHLREILRIFSDGICPHCGHNSHSNICYTYKVILKQIRYHKWYQFWKRKYEYIGKDEFSKQWLAKNYNK